MFTLFFYFSIGQKTGKNYWDQKLMKCVSFWAQKLTHLGPELMLTHFNDCWAQKLTEYVSFWAQKSLKWVSKVLAPETDIMGQFLGPETDVMGERYFMEGPMLGRRPKSPPARPSSGVKKTRAKPELFARQSLFFF
jgi:hypothetical protein